jgi:hypothetical protein
VRGDASAIVRTRKAIAQSDPEHLQLALLFRGRFVVRQGGRSVRIARGEVTTFDSSRPYVVHAPEPFEHVVYSVPRELLGSDADRLARMTALAGRVIDLLRGLPHARPADLLVASIKAFIEPHLGDPALGPERIARAHFISTRYLHRLFEGEELTVA